jgi:hypothetical protein
MRYYITAWTAGILLWCSAGSTWGAETTVEQWGLFEASLGGPAEGNPFADVDFSATFALENAPGGRELEVSGFYDGEETYRVRFMPPAPGRWRYTTHSNAAALDGKTGEFLVTEPSEGNHGPVRVHNTFHFAYADGTPYRQIGTTCYAWIHQSDELQDATLRTLEAGPFNKIRMCVFPKRYTWNENEPPRYPFAGAPQRPGTRPSRLPGARWDFDRFNPEFFQHLERQVARLGALRIEADVILFHPYDKGHWGFDRMPDDLDDRYVRYVVSRLAAYRNVWWSLANEYDFMTEKQESDWDRLFQVVRDADPYGRLRSIHNGYQIYNHTHPWVTHASIQNGSAVEDAGRAILYRDTYRKPIVFDEVKYEGDIPKRWGNLPAEEMVHRFWQGAIAGTYVGHGECYLSPDDVLWWSKGGVLHGESPARIAFLRDVLATAPPEGIDTIDKWQYTNIAGKAGEYYLVYFGKDAPSEWTIELPRHELRDGMQFRAEVLDTWNMTVTPVEGTFTLRRHSDYVFRDEQNRAIGLPGQAWMAVRLTRVKE